MWRRFTVDAYPDDIFTGNVRQVRLEATTESSVVTYEVVISAANPELKLKPGLTANVTIYTLDRQNVCAVPSKALRFAPDPGLISKLGLSISGVPAGAPASGAVWVLDGQTLRPTAVSTGASDGDMTEILSGLHEGEQVVLGLKMAVPADVMKSPGAQERSPFMPGPPR